MHHSDNVTREPESYRKHGCVWPGGCIPHSCHTGSCSKAENVTPPTTHSKQQGPHFLPETDNEAGAEVREEFCLLFASPPPRPSSSNCFRLFSFFFSPPCSVLFRSDFLALQERLQKTGEERGQLMEKIWGK